MLPPWEPADRATEATPTLRPLQMQGSLLSLPLTWPPHGSSPWPQHRPAQRAPPAASSPRAPLCHQGELFTVQAQVGTFAYENLQHLKSMPCKIGAFI